MTMAARTERMIYSPILNLVVVGLANLVGHGLGFQRISGAKLVDDVHAHELLHYVEGALLFIRQFCKGNIPHKLLRDKNVLPVVGEAGNAPDGEQRFFTLASLFVCLMIVRTPNMEPSIFV